MFFVDILCLGRTGICVSHACQRVLQFPFRPGYRQKPTPQTYGTCRRSGIQYIGDMCVQISRIFAQTLNECGFTVPVPHIALPIGISFYTFQSISYLMDVYRGVSPAQRRFSDLLLYISMFPQLIAGPIVRYQTVAEEIHDRHVTSRDFADGAYRFLIGLGKKVLIANQLSEISGQFLVDGLGSLSTAGAWIGIIAFTLQIYFDFSGYSDMAIGMGRCLGFHFNENFRHPYCCTSITDFWRRWHISLGSFSAIMYISRWEATVVIRLSISWWCGFSPVCGMVRVGIS